MENEERNEGATAEEQPGSEQPAAEEQPVTVTLRVLLPAQANEDLKSLANLWGETKTDTARKLLTGAIQRQIQANKQLGRL